MSAPIILVPLDGSKQALSAVPVAKVFGEIEQLSLHILHVSEQQPAGADVRGRLSHGTEVLDGLAIDERTGRSETLIPQAARELDTQLIVMCRHTSDEPRKLLGRTAIKVLRDAPCPVVLVPPERGLVSWHLQHVLVPHDGTPTTSAALKPAIEIAELAEAELLVAHVTDVGATPAEPGSYTAPRYVDQPQHEWPAWSNEFAKRLASLCPLAHTHVRVVLAHGNAAAEVLRLSDRQSTDLIILAWRGKWEIPRAATLKAILRQSSCPAMVVRAEGPCCAQ